MKLSDSNIKKLLIFSQKKAFLIFRETEAPKKNVLYFTGNGTLLNFRNRPKKLAIFPEVTLRAQKIKETHSEKIYYILGNGTL